MRKRHKKNLRKWGACVICKRPARMANPASFCMRHWHKWFNGEKINRRLFGDDE